MMRTMLVAGLISCVLPALAPSASGADEWKAAEGPLMTRWAKEVSPVNARPEYPRPQMVRKQWQSLNGLWQFAARAENEPPPIGSELKERILVPFPVESALSGIMRHESRMWYRRTFEVPKDWQGKHLLLHFDAIDWEATAYLNGKKLPTHRGGYDAFGFDITGFLSKDGPQELIVGVTDPTDAGEQPRGKQVTHPNGIWYTPTSGIWQTVWIEPVNRPFIESLKIIPDLDAGAVHITASVAAARNSDEVEVQVRPAAGTDGSREQFQPVSGRPNSQITKKVDHPHLWSPDDPFLYALHVSLRRGGNVVDEVDSYFAMRKVSIGQDDKGVTRIRLNDKPIFMLGPLDQGFWPDGIYTAPTDEALKFDIEAEKKLGFNMVHKHVKVEPERWYYWCDKLGLFVWQDMPSGSEKPIKTDEGRTQFERELDRLVQGRGNHPCIIMWVVFNEGWGQFDTERLVNHVKETDPTRLVDNASGWTDKGVGDVIDKHNYPDPAMPPPEKTRAAVLGEFGGLGLAIDGHTWAKKHWGYRGVADQEHLTQQYVDMLDHAWALRDKGLSAAVYTQITDVETETNGLLTYDREVFKVDPNRAAVAAHGQVQRAGP